MNALVSVKPDYDAQNERAYRQYVEGEFALTYRKTENLIIPYGYYLGFNGVTGKEVVLGLNGSDQFTISIDGATAFALASDSSVSSVSAEVIAARQGETSLSAKVTQLSTATSTVDGKLTASYSLTVDVNGRIASMKLLSNGTTTDIVFTATVFQIYDGVNERALFNASAGVVTINGDIAVSGSILVGAVRWPVALQSKTLYVADGGSVLWASGAALSAIPPVTILTPAGVALAAGEAWEEPTLVGATTVGATLRLKISTPGSTSSVTDTTDSSGGGGAPDRVMGKADSADAYNSIYNFRIQGTINISSESIGGGDYIHYGEAVFVSAFNDGGGWDTGPTITISVLDALGYEYSSTNITTPQAFDVTVAVTWGNPVGQHGGTEWGVSYVSGGSLTDFVSVQYYKKSATGVRTGSPSGEAATLVILPRNI